MIVLEKISAKDAAEVVAKINGKGRYPRRSKYGNIRTIIGGVAFASKREANDWIYLKRLETAGEIFELKRQVKFELYASAQDGSRVERAITYIADFTWKDKQGAFHVGDSKGCITAEFRIKKKMMLICHGIEVELM